jgi:hypothetical protein
MRCQLDHGQPRSSFALHPLAIPSVCCCSCSAVPQATGILIVGVVSNAVL